MKILIVDDEIMIRNVLREYVEFEGNEAYEAEDGMQAVKLCRDNDYDLVLMDVMMPHLDGYSAVKEIKKIKDVPVIMLSARGEEYDKLFAFEIGVDETLLAQRSNGAYQRRDQTPRRQGTEERDFEVRGLGNRYGGQKRVRRRRKSGAYPQGIRAVVLFGP